jgi:hypothetical protein
MNNIDKLEQFYVTILKKKEGMEPIEEYCKNVFETVMKSIVFDIPFGTLNYTINMYNVFLAVNKKLIKRKISIICLLFSDGQKIFVNKQKLTNITFFKNYFEMNDVTTNDIILDFPLNDILDDYDTMYKMISFINSGNVPLFDIHDYNILRKMAIVNNYLLDVISDDNIKFVAQNSNDKRYYGVDQCHTSMTTLLQTYAEEILHKLTSTEFCYVDGCFNNIAELLDILNINDKIYIPQNSKLLQLADILVTSPLCKYLCKTTLNTLTNKNFCLTFSDGNQIFESEYILRNILFFKNMLDSMTLDGTIKEIKLTGCIDDFNVMTKIINYVKFETYNSSQSPKSLYKLAIVDKYLIEVLNSRYSSKLSDKIIVQKNRYARDYKNYNVEILDIIFNLNKLYNVKSTIYINEVVTIPDYKTTLYYLENQVQFDNYVKNKL